MNPVWALKKRDSESIVAIFEHSKDAYQEKESGNHYVEKHVVFESTDERDRLAE